MVVCLLSSESDSLFFDSYKPLPQEEEVLEVEEAQV